MLDVRTRMASVVVAAGLVLAACGDDDGGGGGDSADADAVVEAMVDEGATEEEARCFVDEVGADDAERFVSVEESELSEDEIARFVSAITECSPEAGG